MSETINKIKERVSGILKVMLDAEVLGLKLRKVEINSEETTASGEYISMGKKGTFDVVLVDDEIKSAEIKEEGG